MEISVVIPTYNRALLIRETLAAVLHQTCPPAEVIVVDDGSTDETAEVVGSIRDPRIRYHRIANAGATVARQCGIDLAQHDWIAFCDSDDLWTPEKLELQTRLAQLRPDLKLIFTNFRIVADGQWEPVAKFDTAPEGYWNVLTLLADELGVTTQPMYADLVRWQTMFPSTMLVHRSIFAEIGPLDGRFSRYQSEDLEFALRCGHLECLGIVTRPVVGIRKHPGNLSGGSSYGFVWSDVQILEHSLAHHPLGPVFRNEILAQVRSRSGLVAAEAFSEGDLTRCRAALQRIPFRQRGWRLKIKGLLSALPDPLLLGILRMRNARHR